MPTRTERSRSLSGQVLLALSVLGLFVTAGCRSPMRPPDLRGIYDRAAKLHHVDRNPVVVVPGILGTRLVDTDSGRVVWGAFGGGSADPSKAQGARLVALPMEPGRPLAELRDNVAVDGVLESLRVRLLGLPLELQAYVDILRTLGAGGYRDSAFSPEDYRGLGLDYGEGHFTCFQFPYDWRRDNVESARRLFRFLKQTRDQVAAERERRWGRTDPVRFDVIAHSMGGLVLRYMLRYGDAELPEEGPLPEPTWAGAELVERAILVATPNAGALDALEDLAFGRDFGPFLPRYPPAVLGTLPGGYQLLPRHRHRALVDSAGGSMDFLDPDTWIRKGWGLADPAEASVLEQLLPGIGDPEERRRVALDHLEKSLRRARRFHQALDRPSAPPATTELVLFAGDSEPTPTRARFEPGKRRLEIIEQGPGDGTVSRASALMDERSGLDHFVPTLRSPVRWSQVSFLFTDHLGITSDPTFSDNVLYLLLEAPPLADP